MQMQLTQKDFLEQCNLTNVLGPIKKYGFGLKTGYFAVGVCNQEAINLWDKTFKESEYMNTLIMDVCNCRYVVYKYRPGLGINSRQFTDGIQVLSDHSRLSSSSYNVVNLKKPVYPPQKLVKMLKLYDNTKTRAAPWEYSFAETSVIGTPLYKGKTGKWMLFYRYGQEYEDAWKKVIQLDKECKLGGMIKRSAEGGNPIYNNSDSGVIIVYTRDYDDRDDVYRVAGVLRDELKYNKTMYYKTDEQSRANIYRVTGGKKNHLYSY